MPIKKPAKTPTTSISAKLLEPVIQLARHYPQKQPIDYVDAILAQAQLTEDEFNKPGVRFAAEQFPKVLNLIATFSANPLIGLSLGEATQPQILGSVGFMMSTATTLGVAYQVLIDYLPLLHEGIAIDLEQDESTTTLTFELNQPDQAVIEFFTACLMNWPRHLTAHQIPAKTIRLTLAQPDNDRSYQQHLAAEIEFSANQNQIIFDSAYFTLPCIDANAEIHQLHRDFADTLMSRIGVESALTARTRNMIRQQLLNQQGLVRREEVAATFGMSLRTFQRKLGEQGASFQEIYDQTRKDLCLQLIQQGQHSFGEISYQLGFSNQSAFQKAFKRWTQTTPSQYRAQLQPELLSIAELNSSTDVSAADAPQSLDEIQQASAYLTGFCRDLLAIAAVCGETFNLQQLSRLTSEPIARLAIHLWPPEKSALIRCLNDHADRTQFQFSSHEIQQFCYQSQSLALQQQRHAKYAHLLLQTLPDKPQTQIYDTLLQHIQHANNAFDSADSASALTALSQAKAQALEAKDYSRACDYQAEIMRLSASDDTEYQLGYHYSELLLLANRIEAAQTQAERLQKQLVKTQRLQTDNSQQQIQQTALQRVQQKVLQARIYQHQGDDRRALELLLQTLQSFQQPLPLDTNNQLELLVEDLRDIQDYMQQTANVAKVGSIAESVSLMLLYEQICLLGRQLEQPLLAACAITCMVKNTMHRGPNLYSAFAFASFAWVASWFCADMPTARRAMQFSRLHLQSTPITTEEQQLSTRTLDPDFILSAQVEHWVTPIEQVKQQLLLVSESCAERHLLFAQDESMQLHFQLQLFRSGELSLAEMAKTIKTPVELAPVFLKSGFSKSDPLKSDSLGSSSLESGSVKPSAVKSDALKASTLYLIECLSVGKKAAQTPTQPKSAWTLAADLFASFLLQDEANWPHMLRIEAQLENQLPGYFCLSEALFAAAMIKIQQAHHHGRFSRKREYEFQQTCSRFELWSQSCESNFAIQYQLLCAEQQRFQGSDAGPLFDQIVTQLLKRPFSYLLPLTLQRYADYLRQQQPQLAKLCLQNAQQHYLNWGADAVAELVAQQLDLLAQ